MRLASSLALVTTLGSLQCALPSRSTLCAEGGEASELFGSASCNVCLAEQCCQEAAACEADAGCSALMRCMDDCGDEVCFATCRQETEYDAAPVDALLACADARCEGPGTDCVLPERAATCTTAGAVPDLFATAPCDLCMRRLACDAATNCFQNDGCRARADCYASCTGTSRHPACFDQCRGDGLVGVGDASLFQGASQYCRDECGIGSSFECTGNYRWPTTTQPTVLLETQALNRLDGTPFVGLEVTPCALGTTPCASVGNTQTTDASGIVMVQAPTINGFDPVDEGIYSGFRGYLLFDDPLDDTEWWVDTLVVRARPEYRDRTHDEPAPFAPGFLLKALFSGIANQSPVLALDPERGFALGAAVDCHGIAELFAHGIVAEVDGADESLRVAYINAAQSMIDTSLTSTSVSGQFAMINVKPGERAFTFRRESTGEVIASMGALIEAGRATIIGAWPQTRP